MIPERCAHAVNRNRRYEAREEQPADTNPDSEYARERLPRHDIAVTNGEAGDEGEIQRITDSPALDKSNQQAKDHLNRKNDRQDRPRDVKGVAERHQSVAQATATTIAESAPALEGSAQACEGDPSNQRCSVGRARKPLSPRAANEAPMIAALPLGRTTAPVPVSPAAPLNPADAASTIVSTPAVGDPDETPAPAAKKVRKPSRKNGGHGMSRDRRWRDDQWSARAYALPDNRYLRSPYEWSWGRSW